MSMRKGDCRRKKTAPERKRLANRLCLAAGLPVGRPKLAAKESIEAACESSAQLRQWEAHEHAEERRRDRQWRITQGLAVNPPRKRNQFKRRVSRNPDRELTPSEERRGLKLEKGLKPRDSNAPGVKNPDGLHRPRRLSQREERMRADHASPYWRGER